MKKLGYCKQCLRNVPHKLFFRWPIFRFMNRIPDFAGTLWISSWNCCACEKHIYILRKPLEEATTDLTSTDMSDVLPFCDPRPTTRQGMFLRRLFPQREPTAKATTTVPQPEGSSDSAVSEKVGNFLRGDESLVVRSTRASRYTKKYRESVVERILSGQATITQVRNELGVTERDVLDWINDRVLKQHNKIAKLTQVIQTVRQLTDESESDASPEIQQKLESHPPEIKLFKDKDKKQDQKVPASKQANADIVEGTIQPRKSNP